MFSSISDTGDSEEKIWVLPTGVKAMTLASTSNQKVIGSTPFGRTWIFSSESPVSLIKENIISHLLTRLKIHIYIMLYGVKITKTCSPLTLTIGVMNSSKNGKRVKFGQLLWIKLMRSPLMCEPSWSWSVMIITWPYLKVFRSSSDEYFLLYCRPRILIKLLISALSRIWNHTFSQLCVTFLFSFQFSYIYQSTYKDFYQGWC